MCVLLFLFCALFLHLSSKKKPGFELEKLIQSIFVFLTASILVSQSRIGDWESYTSPLIIHDLIELDSKVLCATEGGLLIYDVASEEFSTLTNIDGLIGTNLNVIEKDLFGNIWLGGALPNGFIQVYDPSESSSIAEFDYDLTEIVDIAVGDTIAFGVYKLNLDFGIQKFLHDGNRWSHNDLMFASWLYSAGTIEGIEIWNDFVFIGTENGLYSGTIHEDPGLWNLVLPELNGYVTSLHVMDDKLIVVCDRIVYELSLPDLEIKVLADYMNWPLMDLVITFDGNLFGVLSNAFIKLGQDGYDWIFHFPSYTVNVILGLDNNQVVAGTNTGLAFVDENYMKFDYKIPNAPLTNQFSAVTVLDDGRVVAGSKYGLAIKEDWGWRNIVETTLDDVIVHNSFDSNFFAADTIPVDFGGYVADLEQGPDGLVYCAIRGTYPEPIRHGGGIIIIDVDNPPDFSIIDTTYLSYFTKNSNPDPYMVVKDLEFDSKGNLWVADAYATNKFESIQVLNTAGAWGSFIAEEEGVLSLTTNTIAHDFYNRVWIGSFEGEENVVGGVSYPNGGLIMLRYEGEPINPSDFQMKEIDVSPNNSNNTVWSLAMTPENRLYALTPIGLTYFDLSYSNENPILRQGPRATNGELYYYFPNISFGGPNQNAKLKADNRGNIWATSTTDGIHVLLNNATYWPDIDGFRKSNSLLLSDGVTDIEFDSKKGIAWITTNRGISAVRIPFTQEREHYKNLRIFPSPFHVPSETPLVVDGLKDASSLKVMTITGRVLRDIKNIDLGTHGDQITWDGRDKQGRWVGSGVYLLSVYDETGESTFGKVTVIRH